MLTNLELNERLRINVMCLQNAHLLTNEQMAHILHVTRRTYQNFTSGRTTQIKLSFVWYTMCYFHVSFNELIK